MKTKLGNSTYPEAVREKCELIFSKMKEFSDQFLNNNYLEICQKVLLGLARKKPSPLCRGQIPIWACSIVYAVGQENFLFDKDQNPHVSAQELRDFFDCSESTVSNKAKEIRNALKMKKFDHKWLTSEMIETNPMSWMIQVNGFIIDARKAPEEIQEVAFKKGLIPYLPKTKK